MRLNYWLDKGLAIGDPMALAAMGMRLYYEDEEAAIVYLSKAADAGNAQAALFCGSACRNQGKGDDAFKYLTKAYELGCPVPAGILRCAIRRASAHLSIATKP